MREYLFPRLRYYFHFENRLKLFAEIRDTRKYCVVVYGLNSRDSIQAIQISGLYHPSTIDGSFEHDGLGPVPGKKTSENQWELRGHRSRVVRIDESGLRLFAKAVGW